MTNGEDKIVDILCIVAIISVIILKITGVITVSWLWLLSPIWISLSAGIIITLVILIAYFIYNKRRK